MSLSVSLPPNNRLRYVKTEEPDVDKISAAVGMLFTAKNSQTSKSDCIIALFDDHPFKTTCRLVLKDRGKYIGTWTAAAYGFHQRNRACYALSRALKKAGIHVEGTPALEDPRSGIVTMRSTIKAILKEIRFDGEFTSANVY